MTRLVRKRVVSFVALTAIAALVAGCDVGWPQERWGSASVRGKAMLRSDGLPVAGAQITLDGPVRRQVTTSRSGVFTLAGLPEGRYSATLRALHDSYTRPLWVQGDQVVNWWLEPISYDRELFYQISGLKEYYADGSGRLTWDYGQLVRWEKDLVRVYLDELGAPYGYHPSWPDHYWQEVRRWESILKGRITFRRVYRAGDADLILVWQPQGFLGDHAGIARHLAYYENGALKRVQIEIDVAYGDRFELWAHELAHGMGVGHVTDPRSVMYPWLEHAQRNTFSQTETAQVRLMYDLPSGQQLSGGYGMAAVDGDGGGELSPLSRQASTGHRGHVTSLNGVHELLDPAEVSGLMRGRAQ